MKNHELLFNKFVGVVNEDSATAMSRFLDGEEEINQDVTMTPGVEDAGVEPTAEPPVDDNGIPMDDQTMMDSEFAPPGPPEMIDPNISETQKELNLLDLFLTLKKDTEALQELFDKCDFSPIQEEYYKELTLIEDGIDETHRKLLAYIVDNYQYETYEKSLYIYLMLRQEVLFIAKKLNELTEKVKKKKDE